MKPHEVITECKKKVILKLHSGKNSTIRKYYEAQVVRKF